jgi:hypothetical protein
VALSVTESLGHLSWESGGQPRADAQIAKSIRPTRQTNYFLSSLSFPSEQGVKTSDNSKRDAAIDAWAQFAEAITKDATVPFPGSA